MRIRYFDIDEDTNQLRPIETKENSCRRPEASWIDIDGGNRSSIATLLSHLELDDTVLDIVHSRRPAAHVCVCDNAVVVRFPTTCNRRSERSSLVLVLGDQRVVTLHAQPLPGLEMFIERCQHAAIRSNGLPYLVYELLDALADEVVAQTLLARDRVVTIEQAVDDKPDGFDPEEARRVRRRIVGLEAILEDQHHALSGLLTLGLDQFEKDKQLGRDLLSHIDHAIRVSGRFADRLSTVQDHYSLTLAERQNQKLNVLATVSAVFLPLALITGIYGMNFRYMPELTFQYGYPVVLFVLAGVAAGLVWVLYRKGWFR